MPEPTTPIQPPTKPKRSLAEQGKDIAIVAGIVGAGVAVWKIMGFFDKGEDQKKNEVLTQKQIDAIQVDSSRINTNLLVYRTIAETLEGEMSKRVLTYKYYDFDKMRNALTGLNAEELKQVVKEFGTRAARLFNLIEVGGGGSLFDWFDAIITDKDERETLKEIFVFTGLDKLPTQGMKFYFEYNDQGWFDKESPMRAIAALWKPFYKTTSVRKVYPLLGNKQYISVLEKTATGYTQRQLKAAGFGAIGEYVGYNPNTVSSTGMVPDLAIKITDTRLGDWYGKTIWANSRLFNQTPPINNPSLYPL